MEIIIGWLPMSFPSRLAQLRKQKGLSQQALADIADLHVNQVKRYETGTAQPTLEALIKLAKTLHVSLDNLVFEEDERGPDEGFKLQFEAISQMPKEEKEIIRALLDGMIVKYQTQKIINNLNR